MDEQREWWVAERFWPGATEVDARAALDALRTSCQLLAGQARIRFAGGTYFPDDETIAARFEGSRPAVVAVHELARCEFDRLSRAIEIDG